MIYLSFLGAFYKMCFLIKGVKKLKEIEDKFEARPIINRFKEFESLSKKYPEEFKKILDSGHIYPNYFAPVITRECEDFFISPMRYRLRPHGSKEEIPSHYNVFNARLDSLLKRKSWRPLIGKNHGIVILKRFYEWVEGSEGKKTLISFYPESGNDLYVPVLYDYYEGNLEQNFYSYAVITDDPPREVLEAGHDRVPIHLTKDEAKFWLHSDQSNAIGWCDFLSNKRHEFFKYDVESSLPKVESRQIGLF